MCASSNEFGANRRPVTSSRRCEGGELLARQKKQARSVGERACYGERRIGRSTLPADGRRMGSLLRLILLHGVLGHCIVLLHGIVGHCIVLLHGIVRHLVLRESNRGRRCSQRDDDGGSEKQNTRGVFHSLYPFKIGVERRLSSDSIRYG